MPGHADDGDRCIRQDAADRSVGLEAFESQPGRVLFVRVTRTRLLWPGIELATHFSLASS